MSLSPRSPERRFVALSRALLALCAVVAFFAPLGPAVLRETALAGPSDRSGAVREPAIRELCDAVRCRDGNPSHRPWLGVVTVAVADGLRVTTLMPDSPAANSGLAVGDVILSVAGQSVRSLDDLDTILASQRPWRAADVTFLRGGRAWRVTPTLGGRAPDAGLFTGSSFRLAVVPLRFAGESDAADAGRLRTMLFGPSPRATLSDFYADQSSGRLSVTGDVLETVDLPGRRREYSEQPMGGTDRSAFTAAAKILAARLGAARAARYDGIAFVYAGAPERRAGFALWPHRAQVTIHGRRVSYYVHAADEAGGDAIGVHCHEFGHLVGLADAYGTGHRTGSGDFCLMAIGHRGGPAHGAAVPFPLCGPCRASLGWAEEVVVDPTIPQRIRIRPMQPGRAQVMVVPSTPGTSERLVLEVRARRGFAAELPSEGLLVWRIDGRPTPGSAGYGIAHDLVEAHGVDVLDASLVRTGEIAFPTYRARDLTPHTRPASTHHDGPTAPYLTDIVREADGSVVVTVGVRRGVRQDAPPATPADTPGPDGFLDRTDPVTGERVRFWPGGGAPDPGASTAGQRR